MIGRPIKKVLRKGLIPNWTTVLLFQPIGLGHKTSESRLDCNNCIFWFLCDRYAGSRAVKMTIRVGKKKVA